jgi:predicted HTH transcriptional regulator
MKYKPLEQIREDDLQLILGVTESRELEFKEKLGKSDQDVKEFLKDVSAMANATGGDLIYGIVQDVDNSPSPPTPSFDSARGSS